MTHSSDSTEKIPFWRDDRVWRIIIQLIVLGVVVLIGSILLGNMFRNLAQLGRQFDFGFLRNQAGFNIGETIVPYQTNDRYWWALVVGFLNTLRLILVGFVLATVIGVLAGIASFSDNWLLRKLNVFYVEIVRNVPLLLQLFFWIFVVFYSLAPQRSLNDPPTPLLGKGFINKAGLFIPWPANNLGDWLALLGVVLGAIAAFFVWRWRVHLMETVGASGKTQQWILIGLAIAGLLVLLFGMKWETPILGENNRITGGLRISLEYAAVLAGLSFYTGAFIAEIVRAGIQSVSKGQWEAARALGLHTGLAMQLVVLPQALRVIIPSLNSQYQNLAKNSTLALAIGYPDFFSTFQTTQNQTGRAVEMILILMAVYLIINLVITTLMNLLNRAVQLKER
ncbi:ABC transporter permease subunit [Thermoleptolyngbya sp. M55_K2018_002]|uniref:amino acid ABC transporter permease n=1 Tax=Thermoleptolyngbya sp. M55_K2018_002 TaxID=2747808 RepID=UPI0019F8C352|nr:ABC transporter permease subunit [Thermoleptolyngbya sp. M55_K2018_002]HIK39401.1 ABC transporter permease subunit [Thermoleptolyngbya sp. M55_K2018_002]